MENNTASDHKKIFKTIKRNELFISERIVNLKQLEQLIKEENIYIQS